MVHKYVKIVNRWGIVSQIFFKINILILAKIREIHILYKGLTAYQLLTLMSVNVLMSFVVL